MAACCRPMAAGMPRTASPRRRLRPHGGLNSKFSFARLSAYQRIQAEGLAGLSSTRGPGPERPARLHAHAGALALTIDDGPERLITSCGSNPDLEPGAARCGAADSGAFGPVAER